MFKRFMLTLVMICSLFAASAFPAKAATIEQTDTGTIIALAKWVLNVTRNKITEPEARGIVRESYRYGKVHNIDPLIVLSIIKSESTFQRKASAKHGSRGLMQVIPYWHRDKIKGRDIFASSVNIDVGTQVFDKCMDKTKDEVRAALFCYRGAKDTKYVAKIEQTHKALRTYLVETQFNNQEPIEDTRQFSDGRMYTPAEHQEVLAMKERDPVPA